MLSRAEQIKWCVWETSIVNKSCFDTVNIDRIDREPLLSYLIS